MPKAASPANLAALTVLTLTRMFAGVTLTTCPARPSVIAERLWLTAIRSHATISCGDIICRRLSSFCCCARCQDGSPNPLALGKGPQRLMQSAPLTKGRHCDAQRAHRFFLPCVDRIQRLFACRNHAARGFKRTAHLGCPRLGLGRAEKQRRPLLFLSSRQMVADDRGGQPQPAARRTQAARISDCHKDGKAAAILNQLSNSGKNAFARTGAIEKVRSVYRWPLPTGNRRQQCSQAPPRARPRAPASICGSCTSTLATRLSCGLPLAGPHRFCVRSMRPDSQRYGP
jgi:hypothetical protein